MDRAGHAGPVSKLVSQSGKGMESWKESWKGGMEGSWPWGFFSILSLSLSLSLSLFLSLALVFDFDFVHKVFPAAYTFLLAGCGVGNFMELYCIVSIQYEGSTSYGTCVIS